MRESGGEREESLIVSGDSVVSHLRSLCVALDILGGSNRGRN